MMKNYFTFSFFIGLLLLCSTSNFTVYSQNADCDNERYVNEIFSDVDTTLALKFGENTTIGGNFQELYMDVFEPEGDTAEERPVVIMAFGGSFVFGQRSDVHGLCANWAKKGYVSVAMDYRLFDLVAIPDSALMIDVVMKTVADMKAVVRVLRKDAANENNFRIDTDNIYVGGISAGGIVALHCAYINENDDLPQYVADAIDANGGLEGNTDDPENSNMGYSSEVQGVVNYFGALHKSEWLTTGDVPIISIHGTADNVVPYSEGFATVTLAPGATLNIIKVNGSGIIHPRADEVGVRNQLITVPDAGHGTFATEWYDSMAVSSAKFLNELICETIASNNLQANLTQTTATIYPNPATNYLQIRLNNADVQAIESIRLLDQLGRTLAIQTAINEQNVLSFERKNLTAGLYLLQIEFKNKATRPLVEAIIVE